MHGDHARQSQPLRNGNMIGPENRQYFKTISNNNVQMCSLHSKLIIMHKQDFLKNTQVAL